MADNQLRSRRVKSSAPFFSRESSVVTHSKPEIMMDNQGLPISTLGGLSMFLKMLIQTISIYRAVAMMIFILFYTKIPDEVLSLLLITALLSDLLDGYLARKLKLAATNGKLLDLFSDKYLNCIAVLFLIVKEYPILPLIIILTKEFFILSFRSIEIDGNFVITTNRFLGGIMSAALWFAVFCDITLAVK